MLGLLFLGLTRADANANDQAGERSSLQLSQSPEISEIQDTGAVLDEDTAPLLDSGSINPAASNSPFVVKRILKIDEPFVHGFYAWDDEGVPEGEIIITVDLKAESLSVFRGGYEIGAAAILFGADEKPTPTGVFPITQKSADHVSNLYGSPMPFMLRMTNDGISIHGSDVEWGYATHGCIGVPTAFAKLLFEQVKLGDRVIVTDGKMLNVGQAIVAG